jgi:hypothetical protein
VWVVDARSGTIDVIPQDWFSDGEFDFGYPWVTRIARDPETGRLVGEGIRMGFFRLDASNRAVERWESNEPFWMPGSWGPPGPRRARRAGGLGI